MLKNLYFLSFNNIAFTPYTWGLLRSYADQFPELKNSLTWHSPFIFFEKRDRILNQIHNPDILAASCSIWNLQKSLRICREVKKKHPACLVVLGGPQIPEPATEFLRQHPYVDVVVHGEGEVTFSEVLKKYLAGEPFDSIPGISFGDRYTLKGVKPDLETAPSPYLLGYFDEFLKDAKAKGQNPMALWETTRGCPYSCTYCDWAGGMSVKIRAFPMDRLEKEIRYFADYQIRDLECCDGNFGILPRDLNLVQMLAERKSQTGFPRTIHMSFAKNAGERMKQINLALFESELSWSAMLSFQTFTKEVLSNIRRSTIGTDKYRNLLSFYTENGIPTSSEVILGLPGESRDSFIDSLDQLLLNGEHADLRIFECLVLPNAQINKQREEFGLQTSRVPLFPKNRGGWAWDEDEVEYVEIVTSSNSMSVEDWLYCFVYGELLQTFHNGALTRFLSIYLFQEKGMPYSTFYKGLFDHFRKIPDSVLGGIIAKIDTVAREYLTGKHYPQVGRVVADDEMQSFMSGYSPRTGWTLWHWAWMKAQADSTRLFHEINEFVRNSSQIEITSEIVDLLGFQEDIVFTESFDPGVGKRRNYQYNWPDYFFKRQPLERIPLTVTFADTAMGLDSRYPIIAGDRKSYIYAAIGSSFPWSRFRHYFHQFSSMKIAKPREQTFSASI